MKYKITANLYFENKLDALRLAVKVEERLSRVWTKSKLRSFTQVEECYCDEKQPEKCNVIRYIEKE